jgi:outer membrane protein OmpU
MRKLLLSSSALVAAASISSYAVADVSVTGGFEWRYTSISSGVAADDGTEFGTDNTLTITFTNKTDSGLSLTGVYDMDADSAGSDMDESFLQIGGGFGTLRLGQKDSVVESFGIGEHDLIDEDLSQTPTDSSIVTTASETGGGDSNKLAYITPNMGGFQAGYSIADSGTATLSTDTTAMGASYTMPLDGGSLSIKYNKSSTDGQGDGTVANPESEGSNYGAKLVMGAASLIVSHGESTIGTGSGQTDDREANGISVRYNMGGGISIGASTVTAEDDKDKTAAGVAEKYTANIAEVSYTVAPGLSAKVTYVDYDYKAGGETASVDDSGSITQVTISASF